jgi:hypothetical protein
MLSPLLTYSILSICLSIALLQESGSGTFRIQIDGRIAGVERFQTAERPEGHIVSSTSETESGGQVRKVVTSTEFQKKRIVRYDLEIITGSRTEKYSFQFTPQGTRVAIELNGRKTQRSRPAVRDPVLLDKGVWHHYRFLLARYDMKRLGKQRFRIFIPQAAFREYYAEVEYKGSATVKKGDEKREGSRFDIILADGFEVEVIADHTGLPLSIEVPTEKTKAVRE